MVDKCNTTKLKFLPTDVGQTACMFTLNVIDLGFYFSHILCAIAENCRTNIILTGALVDPHPPTASDIDEVFLGIFIFRSIWLLQQQCSVHANILCQVQSIYVPGISSMIQYNCNIADKLSSRTVRTRKCVFSIIRHYIILLTDIPIPIVHKWYNVSRIIIGIQNYHIYLGSSVTRIKSSITLHHTSCK